MKKCKYVINFLISNLTINNPIILSFFIFVLFSLTIFNFGFGSFSTSQKSYAEDKTQDQSQNQADQDQEKTAEQTQPDKNSIELIDNDGNIVCSLNTNKTSCNLEGKGNMMLDISTNTITLNNVQASDKILYTPVGTVNLIYKGNNFFKAIDASFSNYLTLLGTSSDFLTINSVTIEQGMSTKGAIYTKGSLKFVSGNLNLQSQNTTIHADGAILLDNDIKITATTNKEWIFEAANIAISLEENGDIQLFGGIKAGNSLSEIEICLSNSSALDKSNLTPNLQPKDVISGLCVASQNAPNKGDSIHIFYQPPPIVEAENSFFAILPPWLIFCLGLAIISLIIILTAIKKRRQPALLIPFPKSGALNDYNSNEDNNDYSKKLTEFIFQNGRKYEYILAHSSWQIAIKNAILLDFSESDNLSDVFFKIIKTKKIKKIIIYPEQDNLKTVEDLNNLEKIPKIKFKLLK
ncbi:MAG: hypothetical protein LBT91_00995 [Bifidobacteriaceae bacterium]|nr:hypothetical protein [Bifidobacteriaceae bacterium]